MLDTVLLIAIAAMLSNVVYFLGKISKQISELKEPEKNHTEEVKAAEV